MNPRPIGVFDSGIGGLTVVRELLHQLPHESLVYFGDTARVPYGNKSPETVRRYSREIAGYLLGQDVKMIVVACNTASAHALEDLQRACAVPVEGVVGPGARAAARHTRTGRIGVIGTAGTMASGAYARAIRAGAPEAYVVERACPLFVPLVEEGWLDHPATKLIAHEYLDPLTDERIDTLVLGCTHYPLLRKVIGAVMGPGVTLVDSAEATAAVVVERLQERGLLGAPSGNGIDHFFVTDSSDRFREVGSRFLGREIERLEQVDLTE
jgi:glutamate racemase